MGHQQVFFMLSLNNFAQINLIPVVEGINALIALNNRRLNIGRNLGLISANGLIGGAPWANYTHQINNYYVRDNRIGGG